MFVILCGYGTCTVAFGSHAILMNITSLRLNPVPKIDNAVAIVRT